MTATGVMAGGQGRAEAIQTQGIVDHVTGLYHRHYPDYADSTSSVLHSQGGRGRVRKRGRDLVVACEKTRRQTNGRPEETRSARRAARATAGPALLDSAYCRYLQQ